MTFKAILPCVTSRCKDFFKKIFQKKFDCKHPMLCGSISPPRPRVLLFARVVPPLQMFLKNCGMFHNVSHQVNIKPNLLKNKQLQYKKHSDGNPQSRFVQKINFNAFSW